MKNKIKILAACLCFSLFCVACSSIGSDSGSNNHVVQGTKYTYLHDKWHLYIATVLSNTTIKIERWDRFTAGEDGDPFTYDADVCVLKLADDDIDFQWLDSQCTAFTVSLHDDDNYYWDEETTVGFSIEDSDSEILGANWSENGANYTYMHDKWNLYKAIALSDSVIKIEQWGRFTAGADGDPFAYEADVCILKADDGLTDFRWFDNQHVAFSVTMQDANNYYWKEESTAVFSIEDPDYEILGANWSEDGGNYTYTHDKWHLYKAIALSDSVIKVEQWYRFDASEDGDPFSYESDICIIDTNDPDSDFSWFDEERTGFSITMQDSNNSYWQESSTVDFIIMIN